jgi:hypothetical protein
VTNQPRPVALAAVTAFVSTKDVQRKLAEPAAAA